MNEQFLELELRLLVLQFGRQKVLRVLARLGDQTAEELEQQLRDSEEKRKSKRPTPSVTDLASAECREHPEIAEPLRCLAVAFQNRTFLPYLRDVQRFLDRSGLAVGKLRSREAAAPALIRALGKLTRDELIQLAPSNEVHGNSEFSMLAREIMKTPGKGTGEIGERPDRPAKH